MRAPLRLARATVQEAFTRLWGSGFRILGRLAPAVARWHSPGSQQVLVLAPHPDDEVCGCGGTILLHLEQGDRVCVVFVTDGRRSTAFGLAPDVMAQRRRSEAEAAARTLGCEWRWLALPEGEWEPAELASRLRELLGELAPELVYAPSRVDFHPEHHKTAAALAAALAVHLEASQPRVRVVQLQVPLTRTLVNLVADTSAVAAKSGEALRCHESQLGAILLSLRMKRYAAASHGLGRQGEEFWELDGLAYQELHAAPPAKAPYRSLRYYAWTDPLGYCVGRRARRTLREKLDGRERPDVDADRR